MHQNLQLDETAQLSAISTGQLPPAKRVQKLVSEAHRRYKSNDEGKNADYIPALAVTPRNLFGLCVVVIEGAV